MHPRSPSTRSPATPRLVRVCKIGAWGCRRAPNPHLPASTPAARNARPSTCAVVGDSPPGSRSPSRRMRPSRLVLAVQPTLTARRDGCAALTVQLAREQATVRALIRVSSRSKSIAR
ncbi:hypothetical protein MSAN_00561500 [Mycena sanguinolenta]|uniref:Uncharacterized protein n=1 Tax=Mycena sanguinolenta TaxID=230812 RepID=A0A8H7DIH3_9AGAR|nr:hypothetical protein MSAN_00561500 [Mycena sanguinolenta]